MHPGSGSGPGKLRDLWLGSSASAMVLIDGPTEVTLKEIGVLPYVPGNDDNSDRLHGREAMKTCPSCIGEIKKEALKCPFCGEILNKSDQPKTKWYFSTAIVVVALLSVGPFALPLVWFHPRYKTTTKVVVSFIVIALTIWLYFIMKDMYLRFLEQAKELGLF